MLGGEALGGGLVARIQNALPGVEVVNMYGPTEACIDATYHVATPADLSAVVLPIGRPLSNYQAYVLDATLEPVGIGVTGELYLGGVGLARGYVKAPDLTASRFIPDPFSGKPGARLYRTGDLARRRSDGEIEFLGRVDQQVKIRGFRVELGEIEAQLRRQPGIRDAAVIAQESSAGMRLIAYYSGAESFEVEALRAGLASLLPDYMVPSAFVKLAQLPLSANGKLDRKALPDPGKSAFVARAFEPPTGPIEEQMAALWAELLKLDSIGRHDNFFELGGHSLLAVTLIERLRQHGLPGDVRALFTTPTIAGLCASAASTHIEVPANGITPGCDRITPAMLPLVELTQQQIDRIAAVVPGGAQNIQDIYPLSPLQQGILFQHLMTKQGDPYLSPVLLAFDGRDRLVSFLSALNQVAIRHDVLRTAMVWQGLEEPLQVVLRSAAIPIEQVDLNQSGDASKELMARFNPESYRLDLSQAPLLRAITAFDQGCNRWLLLLLAHHLILDHASLEVLVHELKTLMANSQAVLPVAFPYRNFIAETRAGVSPAEHEAFFKRLLADVNEPTAPFGLIEAQSPAETVVGRLQLDPTLSRRICDRANSLGVTPASIFHLAWAAVLSQISGKQDVVFGTVLFGRMRSGIGSDRVVGMFINTLPVRIKLDKTPVTEGVLRTHQLLAELMVHENAPLALAQRCSAVAAPAPLFSSLFNYRYSPDTSGSAVWPGVEMLGAVERTNYPLAMAVERFGFSFLANRLGASAGWRRTRLSLSPPSRIRISRSIGARPADAG